MNAWLIMSVLLLSGCASQNFEEKDDAACRSFGATPGSDVYINCRSAQRAARLSSPVIYNAPAAARAPSAPPPPLSPTYHMPGYGLGGEFKPGEISAGNAKQGTSTIVRNTCRGPNASSDAPTFDVTTTSNPKQQRAFELIKAIQA